MSDLPNDNKPLENKQKLVRQVSWTVQKVGSFKNDPGVGEGGRKDLQSLLFFRRIWITLKELTSLYKSPTN